MILSTGPSSWRGREREIKNVVHNERQERKRGNGREARRKKKREEREGGMGKIKENKRGREREREREREKIERITFTHISVPQPLYMCNNTVIHDPIYHRNLP